MISAHENKKALSPFYHKKSFLIENERKTPYGCKVRTYVHGLKPQGKASVKLTCF